MNFALPVENTWTDIINLLSNLQIRIWYAKSINYLPSIEELKLTDDAEWLILNEFPELCMAFWKVIKVIETI